MKRLLIAMACTCLIMGQAVAEFDLAAFAKSWEANIARACVSEKTPRGKLRSEAIMRNDYERDLLQHRERMIASGKLSTPELEALRKERQALEQQLKDLDRRIVEASARAPEIVELDAVRQANAERVTTIKNKLSPRAQRAQDQDGETKTE